MIRPDFVELMSRYGIAISTLMQLEPYLRSFLCISSCLVKISQEYGGWVGNETSASDLDRKYIGYLALSDTLFSQILIFFQLILMCPSRNILQKGPLFFKNFLLFFKNLTDQMTISGCWVVYAISVGNTKWCSMSVEKSQSARLSSNDGLCLFLCESFEIFPSLTK